MTAKARSGGQILVGGRNVLEQDVTIAGPIVGTLGGAVTALSGAPLPGLPAPSGNNPLAGFLPIR